MNSDHDFSKKKCVPCEKGTPPLKQEEAEHYLSQLKGGWRMEGHGKILREFKFKDFGEAMEFVNRVARLAEEEGHHPNILIRYNRVHLELTTHAIQGLSENDFILAAKIDLLGD